MSNAIKTSTAKVIRLEDYQPPTHQVESIDLLFDLDEEITTVTSTLVIRPNPEAESVRDLYLDGEEIELVGLRLDGLPLKDGYVIGADFLQILNVPDRRFVLEIITHIHPASNTKLEGLYLSDGLFCTQCEAQGFRKITYYPDRPDVMSVFTTTLIAAKEQYPVLLSNGNLDASGDLLDGRHFTRWHDPFPKPSYLFALVAGQLDCLEDRFFTASGREIRLQIFSEPTDIGKCGHALESLKNAMRWDEERFGLEYDLELYMIVAVSHFNMGAMENKGLNIFNTKFVLASPETATDFDYEHIEGVIGHEYFHNWTGNRITLRDWFQLSLKEGLTVYRDQEFSADRHSRAVKRIDEVNLLRNRQFAEDQGPLSHPVRPSSYIEINNFYTLTVYEKGAEIVRMLSTLLGTQGFRKGMDRYFQTMDGKAATCEDFLRAMAEANEVDLSGFAAWYDQSGTPIVHLEESYDEASCTLTLEISQSPSKPGKEPQTRPLVIPIAFGLIDEEGKEVPIILEGDPLPEPTFTKVITLSKEREHFQLKQVPLHTTVSALRNFSAPVRLMQPRSSERLAFQFTHDKDPFNRWDAGQLLSSEAIQSIYRGEQAEDLTTLILRAYEYLGSRSWEDHAYLALLLNLADVDFVGSFLEPYDPVKLKIARDDLKKRLASSLEALWIRLYETHHFDHHDRLDAKAMGQRRIKNLCLDYLGAMIPTQETSYCLRQYKTSRTMTDRMASLNVLVNSEHPERDSVLQAFYEQWKNEDLVVCKWFTLQASSPVFGTVERVVSLMAHPHFDLRTPNHVRSLIGAFTQTNPLQFHRADGKGYRFLREQVIELNGINPQIAARTLTPLTVWRRYDTLRQDLMRRELETIVGSTELSPDVYEVASKALA